MIEQGKPEPQPQPCGKKLYLPDDIYECLLPRGHEPPCNPFAASQPLVPPTGLSGLTRCPKCGSADISKLWAYIVCEQCQQKFDWRFAEKAQPRFRADNWLLEFHPSAMRPHFQCGYDHVDCEQLCALMEEFAAANSSSMTEPLVPQQESTSEERNWVCELMPEEGRNLMALLDAHLHQHNGYKPDCPLCRARSRISIGRDYGVPSEQGMPPQGTAKDWSQVIRLDKTVTSLEIPRNRSFNLFCCECGLGHEVSITWGDPKITLTMIRLKERMPVKQSTGWVSVEPPQEESILAEIEYKFSGHLITERIVCVLKGDDLETEAGDDIGWTKEVIKRWLPTPPSGEKT